MKRMLYLLLCLLIMSVPVRADVLWEPYENDYYWDNYENTATIAAKYEVPDGMTLNVYTQPNGNVIKTLEEGTVVYVGFSLEEGGEVWATGYPLGDFETEGWFRLGRLQKQYSHNEFMTEFAKDITSGGEMKASEIGGSVYTWTYPGSGTSDGILEQDLLVSASDYNDGMLSYSFTYTDPNGGKWGYIGYHMGHVGWMYLDDPTDPAPELDLSVSVENTVTDTRPTEDSPTQNYILPVVLVVGLVALTAVSIIILKKKQR